MDEFGTKDTSLQPSQDASQSDNGGFRLRETLSRSMSSRVYLAETVADGRMVIGKQTSAKDLVDHEAAILRRLGGVAAPGYVATDSVAGRPFVVMERLEGRSLLDLVHAGTLSADSPRFRSLLQALADALAAVHAEGIVHTDLKPDHIVVDEDGSVRLLDFASAMADGASPAISRDFAWTSPGFAAPELLTADRPVDACADVFGFGAVAFWAATGQVPPPLSDRSERAEAEAQLRKSGLPEDLRTLVLACLQPAPGDRPKSARELQDILSGQAAPRAAGPAEAAHPEPEDVPPTVLVRRRRVVSPKPAGESLPQANDRRAGGGGGGRLATFILVLLLVAGAAAAGVWQGKPLYDKHIKTTWTVDSTGGGDALSLREAVSRAGDDVTFLLAPGTYEGATLINGVYRIRPANSDVDAPVIVGGDDGCLRAVGSQVSLEGLVFRGTGGQRGPACIDLSGGELRLLGSTLEEIAGPGIVLRGGASAQMAESALLSVAGDAIRAEGGGVLEILDTRIAEAGGNAVSALGGTELVMRRNQITDTVGTGVLLAEGSVAQMDSDLIQGSKASALEIASGARLQATDVTLAASSGAGVYLHGESRLMLQESRVTDNRLSGIFADGAESLEVRDSVIGNNEEHGILSLGVRSGRLTRNDIGLNGGYGVVLDPESRLEMGGNILESNATGPLLDARDKDAGDEGREEGAE
ncbi:MAG: right-handed parallel beta-helix repeat-containing protein [Rhodovibrionaceae bacterium]|nr:right-handed parallel beta-helix repeat-containing protein [Rhodovibrionaceae bacterium]